MQTRMKRSSDTGNTTTCQPNHPEKSAAVPSSLCILPGNISSTARIVSVPEAQTSTRTRRLLLCPDKGVFELTSIAAQAATCSWLLAPSQEQHEPSTNGFVLRKPDLLITTPLDPVFLILALATSSNESTESYLTCSDYIFAADLFGFQQLQQLLRDPSFGALLGQLEKRLKAISDAIDLGEEEMYRLSNTKICHELLTKAIYMAELGLPASLEERFVKQPFQLPLLHEEAMDTTIAVSQARNTESSESTSQESLESGTSTTTASTAPSSIDNSDDHDTKASSVEHLLRVRTAFNYMLKSYVPAPLHAKLTQVLQEQAQLDFKPLSDFEARINGMKARAQALRTLSDNISRKRVHDDDEAAAKADEKRRRKDEEEQRKKSVSQGVKKLMKANTTGMQKLSSFFTKKPAK